MPQQFDFSGLDVGAKKKEEKKALDFSGLDQSIKDRTSGKFDFSGLSAQVEKREAQEPVALRPAGGGLYEQIPDDKTVRRIERTEASQDYDPRTAWMKSLAGGIGEGFGNLLGTVDKAGQWISKTTGLPRGGGFEKAGEFLTKEGRALTARGLPGPVGDVLHGVGEAAAPIAEITTLGPYGMAIQGGLHGAVDGGAKGALVGTVKGALSHGLLQEIAHLPAIARPVGNFLFGYGTTEGDLSDRIKGAATMIVLGASMRGNRLKLGEFVDNYPKLQKGLAEGYKKTVGKIQGKQQEVKVIYNLMKELDAHVRETRSNLDPKDPKYFVEDNAKPDLMTKQRKKYPGEMPLYKHEAEPVIEEINKKGDVQFGKTWVGSKIKRLIQNPIYVFSGYKALKKSLYDPYVRAEKTTQVERDAIRNTVIPGWKKLIKDSGGNVSESSERIARYLVSLQEGGIERLSASKSKPLFEKDMKPYEMQIVGELQEMHDSFFKLLNESRELVGEKPLKYVPHYFTWMLNMSALKDMGISAVLGQKGQVEYNLNYIPKTAKMAAFRWKKRSEAARNKPILLDAFEVFSKYADDALYFKNVTPVMAKARQMSRWMRTKGEDGKTTNWSMKKNAEVLHNWLNGWVDRIGQKRAPVAPGMDILEHYAAKLNKNIAIGILSLNARSALIQPFALRNTFSEIGGKAMLEGMALNLRKTERDFAMLHSNVLKPRDMDIHQKKMLEGTFKSKVGKAKRAVAEAGIKYSLQFLDMETARATWLGAYHQARRGGLNHKDSVLRADDITTKTQASAKLGDLSDIQGNPLGRFLSLFNTFVINEWNFINREVLGIRGDKIPTAERVAKVGRLVLSTAIANALAEGVLGIRSPFPAPEWELFRSIDDGEKPEDVLINVAKELGEQLPIVGGTIRWSSPGRSALPAGPQTAVDLVPSGVDLIKLGASLITKIIDSDADVNGLSTKTLETIGKAFGIPGTSQIRKYISRRKQGMSHAQAIIGVRTDISRKKGDGLFGGSDKGIF